MSKKIVCEECGLRKAIYSLFRQYAQGVKTWIRVCRICEREIGDENQRKLGGKA